MDQYELIGNQCGGLIQHGQSCGKIIPWSKLMALMDEHGEPLKDCDKFVSTGVCMAENCNR